MLKYFKLMYAFIAFLFLGECAHYDAESGVWGFLALQPVNSASSTSSTSSSSGSCSYGRAESPTISTQQAPARITSSWQIPTGCSADDAIVRKSTAGFPATTTSGSAVAASLTSFTDNGVVAGTLYYYAIFLDYGTNGYSTALKISAIPGKNSIVPTILADNSITIDGLESESAWSSAPVVNYSVTEAYAESGGLDNPSGYVKFAYDSTYFYVFAHLNDKYLFANNGAAVIHLDDALGLYFDMNHDKAANPQADDYQLKLSVKNAERAIARGNGAAYSVIAEPASFQIAHTLTGSLNNNTDIDTGWSLEMRIAYADLGVGAITAGSTIGFALQVYEDDINNHNTWHSYSVTTGAAPFTPSSWSIIQF